MKKITKQLSSVIFLCMFALLAIESGFAIERVTYFHTDELGSPIAATDSQGNVLWTGLYRPYGERIEKINQDSNETWYTGKQHDADIGLSYYGARWYDPAVGRFTGVDPVGVLEGNVHSFNRYVYANNNPYKYIDPDGELPILLLIPVVIKLVDFGLTAYDTYSAYQEGGAVGAASELGTSMAIGAIIPGGKIVSKVISKVGKSGVTKGGPNKGIYEFTDKVTGKPYVGQSGNISKRLKQHEKAGKLEPGCTVCRTEVTGGKTAREIAEHRRIQELTGGVPARRSPDVANKVDPIGPKRQHLLE